MGCNESNSGRLANKEEVRINRTVTDPQIRKDSQRLGTKLGLVQKNTLKVKDNYTFLEIISKDTLGSVHKVKHNIIGEFRAIRVIPLEVLKFYEVEKDFIGELTKLSKLDHINLVKIFDYYIDDKNWPRKNQK